MKTIKFTKMQGSGNDFVVIDTYPCVSLTSRLIQKICDRKFGAGADGILLLEKSKTADMRMRIFNADGSEAEMCGNGARCAALYLSHFSLALKRQNRIELETKAGIIEAEVAGGEVKIKLTDPSDLKLDIKINVAGRIYEVDYVNTGVPHAVVEVEDLKKIPVKEIGRQIRQHDVFSPAGTNVNFIKVIDENEIRIRTYERGVEDETLACGTGSVASAIIATLNHASHQGKDKTKVHEVTVATRSGEKLKVFFKVSKYNVKDVWLEGKAKIVYEGKYFLR